MWVTHPASWLLKCLNLAPLPGSLDHPEVLCISSIQALTQVHSLGSSSRLMRPPSGPLHFVTAVSPLPASLFFLLSRCHEVRHYPPPTDVLSSLLLQAHRSCISIPQDDPTSTLPPVQSAADGGLPIGRHKHMACSHSLATLLNTPASLQPSDSGSSFKSAPLS